MATALAEDVHVSDITLITDDLVQTKQALELRHVITCRLTRDPHGANRRLERFRTTIVRDSYEFQSYAKVEVWRAEGWTTVLYFPGQDPRVADLPSRTNDLAGAASYFGDVGLEFLHLAQRVVA